MQELVYSLNYVLKCMDLMRSWVDIEIEKVYKYMCNLCGEDCESVGYSLWNCPVYSERRALFLEHLKNNLGNEFEHFFKLRYSREIAFHSGDRALGESL